MRMADKGPPCYVRSTIGLLFLVPESLARAYSGPSKVTLRSAMGSSMHKHPCCRWQAPVALPCAVREAGAASTTSAAAAAAADEWQGDLRLVAAVRRKVPRCAAAAAAS